MKAVIVAGIALVVAGLLVFAKEHGLPSPNTVGGLTLGAGVVLLIVGAASAWLSRRPAASA